LTNEALALRLQAGDVAVFEQLAQQNRGLVHRLAWGLWGRLGKQENHYGMAYDQIPSQVQADAAVLRAIQQLTRD